jgi:hypothetical protein
MAEVGVNKTYGFLDNKGAVVIPLNLKHIGNNFPFVNGNAYAVKDNKLVIINLKGEVVKTTNIQSKTYYIEMTADGKYFSLAKETVYDDSNGIMVASSWMVVDLAGKIFFEVKTAYPPSPIATSTGYLIRHDGCHYMDKLMKKIFTISCEDCRPFSPGIVIYVNEQGVAFTDERGKSIKEAVYDNIGELVDGLAWAKKDGKYGFVDDKVNMVIEQKFDMAKNFSDGLALVKQGEKFGYIDKQGQFKIDPTFEVATSFRNGMAQVGTKTNQYLIDKSGKVFFKLKP